MNAIRLILSVLLLAVLSASAQDPWVLVWSDEFDGPAKTQPNAANWNYDLGGGGWGTQELETYTNSNENSFLDGAGNLVIQAEQDPTLGFTSARLKTQGKFQIAYGKIEARIKVTGGQGLWPAFWMLGAGFPAVQWPECGEIDVMENIGKEPSIIHGTVHGPGYSGAGGITASYSLPGGARFSDDFHVFGIVWQPGNIQFYVDGQTYLTVGPSALPQGDAWAFDAPFFLLLNVAVGGVLPGNPDSTTTFPQTMTVDYVRVFRNTAVPIIDPQGVVNAASFAGSLAPGALGSLFGSGLADNAYANLFDSANDRFVNSADGVSVSVNGAPAPLIYLSPTQINFQVPWATPVGTNTSVIVSRSGTLSNFLTLGFSSTSPAVFFTSGQAILTCQAGASALGANCTLWGTGFGLKTVVMQDGVPSTAPPYPLTTNACALSIGGVPTSISYCGAAPGLIIDQLNFVYPPGIAAAQGGVPAVLKVGSGTTTFLVPVPQ